MGAADSGLYELGRLDSFALRDTAVHRIGPRAKVIATLAFIVTVVSFGRYEVVALLPLAVFPLILAIEGDVPLRWLGGRLLAAAPFALVVGMFNPVFDREILLTLWCFAVSGGWVSYLSIIVRFLLTTAAALVLIATTGFTGVCNALERLGVPDVFATQLLFLYRYIFVLGEEALTMGRARDLRSTRRHGRGALVYGRLLGTLLLRTFARAQRIYSAMLLRGFDGRVRARHRATGGAGGVAFALGWCALFLLVRLVNVPDALGAMMIGALS